jgi:hypothetical protein
VKTVLVLVALAVMAACFEARPARVTLVDSGQVYECVDARTWIGVRTNVSCVLADSSRVELSSGVEPIRIQWLPRP